MSSTRLCPKCGEIVDEGGKFCAHCGADITQPSTSDASTNVNKPYTGTPRGEDKRAIDHITIGYTVAFEHPQVFLPPLISGLLGSLVSYGFTGLGDTLSLLVGLVISVFSFILTFASIDMSRDAYYKQPLDVMESVRYIAERFFIFLLAAIFGGLLSITIILIPVVLFMFVIMVMDESGIMDAFQKSIDVIRAELMDVLLIIIISIVASVVISFVPIISSLLNVIVNVIIGIAFIDIYATYRSR
jgi:hypothetical protein